MGAYLNSAYYDENEIKYRYEGVTLNNDHILTVSFAEFDEGCAG